MIKHRYSAPGTAPATLIAHQPCANGQQPILRMVEYNEESIVWRDLKSVAELPTPSDDGKVIWLELNGLSNLELLKGIGEKYGLHVLALEDVLNVGQRPKVESYEKHLFMVVQMFYEESPGEICAEQVSMFLLGNILITIQEDPAADVFDPVRERLRGGRGFIRKSGADYLAYALIDAVVDHFFPVLEQLGDAIEQLEDELLVNPTRACVRKVHDYRRTLIVLRRFIWPERDLLSALLHDESGLIKKDTHIFLRDCYDHAVQIMDIIENYRDLTSGLLEMYLSSVGQRTNEIMRVLTVLSSIFIPLTFIAGVYGMNFDVMPELKQPHGYFVCIGIMAVIAIGQLIWLKHKKWL